ncbi:hypothetical protein A1O3_09500 [Capronia epimyces CBS 606.96]|uniref:Uncharacterized protein n=1 Tax=Capronia epimyces CBS 606.96 TaxID=1182542 RepID=W9Y7I8_9EURO|nr:uncharacterized protein A1O3_09500 [Capronia epimyces CBS 606.96]EXJ78339.1 hypothetical protein A1O3_09500 [Capronia epimyces CBS 606.96]
MAQLSQTSAPFAGEKMSQQREPPRSILEEPTTAAFFIRSSEYPRGQIFHVDKPVEISMLPPVAVRRPAFPEIRKRSMEMLTPCTFFVQYACQQKCRTMGICIHYQFVVGCRKCPDGLRCSLCAQSSVEQAIQACRKCPLHQNSAQANPIGSRPEDFLATDKQKEVCDEVLMRSLACDWHDVPVLPVKQAEDDVGTKSMRFLRETTPKDLKDVEMLETLFEHDLEAEINSANMPVQHAFGLWRGPLEMHMGPAQRPLGYRV